MIGANGNRVQRKQIVLLEINQKCHIINFSNRMLNAWCVWFKSQDVYTRVKVIRSIPYFFDESHSNRQLNINFLPDREKQRKFSMLKKKT